MRRQWDRVAHMNAHAALKPASGGRRYSRAAVKTPDQPAGTWDRLVDETWVDWRDACRAALETFRGAVDPTRGALLAPGETIEDWEF